MRKTKGSSATTTQPSWQVKLDGTKVIQADDDDPYITTALSSAGDLPRLTLQEDGEEDPYVKAVRELMTISDLRRRPEISITSALISTLGEDLDSMAENISATRKALTEHLLLLEETRRSQRSRSRDLANQITCTKRKLQAWTCLGIEVLETLRQFDFDRQPLDTSAGHYNAAEIRLLIDRFWAIGDRRIAVALAELCVTIEQIKRRKSIEREIESARDKTHQAIRSHYKLICDSCRSKRMALQRLRRESIKQNEGSRVERRDPRYWPESVTRLKEIVIIQK